MCPKKPSPYFSQSAVTPQSDHSLGPTQPPTPHSVPSQQPFSTTPYVPHGTITQAVRPQAPRKINAFVACDPIQMFCDDDKIDIPSDGLTFDDISMAEFSPGKFSQTCFCHHHQRLSSPLSLGVVRYLPLIPKKKHFLMFKKNQSSHILLISSDSDGYIVHIHNN